MDRADFKGKIKDAEVRDKALRSHVRETSEVHLSKDTVSDTGIKDSITQIPFKEQPVLRTEAESKYISAEADRYEPVKTEPVPSMTEYSVNDRYDNHDEGYVSKKPEEIPEPVAPIKREERQANNSRYADKDTEKPLKAKENKYATKDRGESEEVSTYKRAVKSEDLEEKKQKSKEKIKEAVKADGKYSSKKNSKAKEKVENAGTRSVSKYAKTKEARVSRKFDSKIHYSDGTKDKAVFKGKPGKDRTLSKNVAKGVMFKQIHSDEADENAAVEASEKGAYVSANASKYVKRATKNGVESTGKYVKKAVKKGVNSAKTVTESTSVVSKADLLMQQKKIEQKYKLAKRNGVSIKEALFKTKEVAVKVAHKIQQIFKRNATLVISIGSVLIMFVVVSAAASSISTAVMQGIGSYIAGLSPTTDREMTDCDSYMDELEIALQENIDSIEETYPDYDEYNYELDEIIHDPFLLMAFLSAEYEDYTLSEQNTIIELVFNELYSLELEEEIEIRQDENQNDYEYKILNVTLTKGDLKEVCESMISTDDNKEKFENYVITGGAHQAYSNPFDFDWSGHISSPFGWRIHPTLKVKQYHEGLDIAEPAGTPIKSTSTGIVIKSTYGENEGNYVVVQDKSGYKVYYMHMSQRVAVQGSEIKQGDLIGYVGKTGRATGNHLHIGIMDENGEWLNPFFLVSSYAE